MGLLFQVSIKLNLLKTSNHYFSFGTIFSLSLSLAAAAIVLGVIPAAAAILPMLQVSPVSNCFKRRNKADASRI